MPRFLLLPSLLLAMACSATAGLKPVSDSDPEVQCPAGRPAWNLQISDQRADRKDSAHVIALLRESLSISFPGCRWSEGRDAGTISIEIYRFSARLDGSIWDAVAEWGVSARDTRGQTLTNFESSSQVSRPNYRNVNNELAALQQALEEAMKRTLTGLRALSPPG